MSIKELFTKKKADLASAIQALNNASMAVEKLKKAAPVFKFLDAECDFVNFESEVSLLDNLSSKKAGFIIADSEVELFAAFGVTVELNRLDATSKKLARTNVVEPAKKAVENHKKAVGDYAAAIGAANSALQRAENERARIEREFDSNLKKTYRSLLLDVAETFGNKESVKPAHVSEYSKLKSLENRMVQIDDRLAVSRLDAVVERLNKLATLTSNTKLSVDSIVGDIDDYADGELPHLVELLCDYGTTVVRAPKGFSKDSIAETLPAVPAEKPEKVKWQTVATVDSADLNQNHVTARAARRQRTKRLETLAGIIKRYPQNGVLSSVRAFEKHKRLLSHTTYDPTRADISAALGGLSKVIQGAINSAIRRAVETSGHDLSLLNYLNDFAIIYTPGVGFLQADYKDYILDTLPHVKWDSKYHKWALKGQRQLENAGLGPFGIYIFGEMPIIDEGGKRPVFPLLDLKRFRQIKKVAQTIAREENARLKARHDEEWSRYSESFPIESQLREVEAELAELDKREKELAARAAALRVAKA